MAERFMYVLAEGGTVPAKAVSLAELRLTPGSPPERVVSGSRGELVLCAD